MTFKCTLLFYYPQNSPPSQFCHFWHRPFQHALKCCIRPECQIPVNSHLKQALHVWLKERSCPTFLDPTFNCNTIILWKRALGCCAFHQHSSVRSLEEKKEGRREKNHNTSCCSSFIFLPSVLTLPASSQLQNSSCCAAPYDTLRATPVPQKHVLFVLTSLILHFRPDWIEFGSQQKFSFNWRFKVTNISNLMNFQGGFL